MHSKKWTQGLLIVYLLMLTWIIVFKMQFSFESLGRFRAINLLPFQGSAMANGVIDRSEIINNVIAFIPFGILLRTLWNEKPFLQQVAPLFLTSLVYEMTQYILMNGATDITDLMMNTLGGLIGLGIAWLFFRFCGQKTIKVINILSLIVAILLGLFIGLLILANY